MNHQPFETWLMQPEPLPPPDAQALQAHLRDCPRCTNLHSALTEVNLLFHHAPTVLPTPGFTQRWQARLQHRQKVIERRQAWLVLALSAGAALAFLLLLLMLVALTLQSPANWFLALIGQITQWVYFLATAQQTVKLLGETLPTGIWLGSGLLLAMILMLWFVSLQKIIAPRRVRA
ncbi:MAG: hypothetical protein OHK0052_05800 [Anaerolineales bacterium]